MTNLNKKNQKKKIGLYLFILFIYNEYRKIII